MSADPPKRDSAAGATFKNLEDVEISGNVVRGGMHLHGGKRVLVSRNLFDGSAAPATSPLNGIPSDPAGTSKMDGTDAMPQTGRFRRGLMWGASLIVAPTIAGILVVHYTNWLAPAKNVEVPASKGAASAAAGAKP